MRNLLIAALLAVSPGLALAQPGPGALVSDPQLATAKQAMDAGDMAKALDLFTKAAADGKPEADVQIAQIYLEGGKGLAPGYAAAKTWAEKAAAAGAGRGTPRPHRRRRDHAADRPVFSASVGPSLDWGDSNALGVAWTQLSGLLAILLMAVVVILSARPRLIERPMRGLDKMYRLHKWLGVGAILIGVAHWLTAMGDGHRRPPPGAAPATQPAAADAVAGAVAGAAQAADAPGLLQSLGGLAHGIAQPALFVLIALGVAALWQRMPYRWFAKADILVVPAFLALVFHSVVLMKSAYWALPIAWVSVGVMALSALAAVNALVH